tara:strand:- start:115 stop:660 length:546 start_codon:yes stop_codon:yes gene_type:complete
MADVKQLITDFYRVAQNRDFARDFNFRLLSISTGGTTSASFGEDDLVYLRAAELPARAITNVPVPYMGLKFNIPGNATYPGSEGYQLRFYADAKSQIRQKFEQWTRDTFDDATSTGNYFTPRATSVIDMVQLDNQNNKIAQYQLVGVSVINCGPLGYNISDGTGATIDFTATISYHYWKQS